VEPFYQTIYQNRSSFTDKAVHGVEEKKTASMVKWSRAKRDLNLLEFLLMISTTVFVSVFLA
jgi:hypothetical protein